MTRPLSLALRRMARPWLTACTGAAAAAIRKDLQEMHRLGHAWGPVPLGRVDARCRGDGQG
jgi:hypothetical protein